MPSSLSVSSRSGLRIRNTLSTYSSWVLLAFILLIGIAVSPRIFFSANNLANLFSQAGVLGLLALAEAVVLFTGNFDLSVEQNMVFTALIGGWLVGGSPGASGLNLNPGAAIVFMIALGAAVGLANGALIGFLGMNAFMGTLASNITIHGLTVYLSWALAGGQRIFGFPQSFSVLGRGRIVGMIPNSLVLLLLVFTLFHLVCTRTIFGRSLMAVGANRSAARASGVNDKLIICLAYVLTGAICGLAGVVLSGRLDSAFPEMSTSLLFYAFAAAVIGGVSMRGGEGRTAGILGGTLIMVVTSNIMNLAIADEYLVELMVGMIILVAVVFDNSRRRLLGL